MDTTVRLYEFDFELIKTAAERSGVSVPDFLARAGRQAALRAQLRAYQGGDDDASMVAFREATDATTLELWTQED